MSAPRPPHGSIAKPTTEPVDQDECPRCGATYDPFQEYCLECGLRLPGERGAGAAVAAARRGQLGNWTLPVLFTFVVALLAAATVVVVQSTSDGSQRPFLVATAGEPSGPPVTETQPVVTETAPEAVPEPPPPPRPQPPAAQGRLAQWPVGVDAYTIVLASMPASGGRANATRKARQASDAGLPEVGVLDSAKYSSLHPGYFVVFSGMYDSLAEAGRFLDQAHSAGFDTAYARLIAS